MAKVKVTINGQKITTDSNKTILEVVHELQIDHIPNLCFEQQLEPYNSCYLCVVEVKGRWNLVPACSTKVQNQMDIITKSPRVKEARRTCLELLLSNHFADCLAPCTMTCPAGVDVQGYIALMSMGLHQEAIRLIKQTNPLPAVCGRVCTRPCELKCRRNLLDEKVGIDYLKRYAADYDLFEAVHYVKPDTEPERNDKVAIVGSGPGGLSAAYYLRLKGYQVTIFEAMPEAGGMLRYGIPVYRLPFDVLDKEIDTILELGVDLQTNMVMGEDFTLRSLLDDQGYDSVFLAMGAWGSRSLGVPGQEADGILSGIKFLEQVGREKPPEIYGKIVVVGGGNTAIDCARTSLRMGAEKVVLLYRRTRNEMPANDLEIEAAAHEGVDMHFLAAPVEVITENNRLTALKCIRMELGEPDSSGRRRPVVIAGSEFIVECDFVFAAIGQNPELSVLVKKPEQMLPENGDLQLTRWGSIEVNPETLETDIPGVFAGGDMVTGAATAIEAIAAGRKAAYSIDTFLQNESPRSYPYTFNSRKDDFKEVLEKDLRYHEKSLPSVMPELKPEERIKTFEEVELGLTADDMLHETKRCLECGCEALFECKLRKYASEYGITVDRFKGEVREYELDRSHPLIELDPNKCILCARCIRVCSEIVGESVYGFETRGFTTIVRPELAKQLADTSCISCGMCIATCPTGAITASSLVEKPGPWDLELTQTTCTFCGVGCTLNIGHVKDNVVKIVACEVNSPTHGNLCNWGRFGFTFINDYQRITSPAIRTKTETVNVSWNDALKHISEKIQESSSLVKGKRTAVFVSPRLTNEEMYIIQKFARIVLKTNNISSISTIDDIQMQPEVQSTATIKDIENADVIVVTLANLRKDHLVADFMVRQAKNKEAKTIYIGPDSEKYFQKFDLYIQIKEGSEPIAMIALMKARIEIGGFVGDAVSGFEQFEKALANIEISALENATDTKWTSFLEAARCLTDAPNAVFVCDRNFAGKRNAHDLRYINTAASIFEASLAVFTENANTQGFIDIINHGEFFPGYQSISDDSVLRKFEKGWRTDLSDINVPSRSLIDDIKNGV
ncbi:FAD-dependent oxidoreductase, partial [bacterium]|nr:FAD-dependent oxidoreductase [candidate division CSSED10-310 bacterium]